MPDTGNRMRSVEILAAQIRGEAATSPATLQERTVPAGMPESLAERYAIVRERVAAAARKSGRRAEDVILVAVTKYADPEQIRELLALGHRDLGENRVQQLVQRAAMVEDYLQRLRVLPTSKHSAGEKAQAVNAESVRWHMIGHLQRNKARKVGEIVRLVHSVDSLRVAEELQTVAIKRDQVIDVLVQVNCSGEESKFGCPIPAAIPLAEQIQTMINVRVRGLMTMAPHGERPDDARPTFARCRELFEEMRVQGVGEAQFNLLSMGMSGDYEVAISEGANIVRVGSQIFGEPAAHETDDVESDE
jgi:pyridoxal phosphate enzyme (YggS family)